MALVFKIIYCLICQFYAFLYKHFCQCSCPDGLMFHNDFLRFIFIFQHPFFKLIGNLQSSQTFIDNAYY